MGRLTIDLDHFDQLAKMRVIGLIECNITGDEKLEDLLLNLLFV
jgi:hypothetical protein